MYMTKTSNFVRVSVSDRPSVFQYYRVKDVATNWCSCIILPPNHAQAVNLDHSYPQYKEDV